MSSKSKKPKNFRRTVIYGGASVLFLIFLIISIFTYLGGGSGGVELRLSIEEEDIRVGVPFDLKVDLINRAKSDLRNMSVFLDLPEGSALVSGDDRKIVRRDIEDLSEGRSHEEVFRLIVLPGSGTHLGFVAGVNYSIGALPAPFERKSEIDIEIAPTELELELEVGDGVIAGAEFEIKAKYRGVGDQNFEALRLELDYPEGFTRISSSRPPDIKDNVWYIDELSTDDFDELLIKGKVDLPDDSDVEFTAKLVARFLGEEYVIFSKSQKVVLAPSPLSIEISTNDNAGRYDPGDEIIYTLMYQNNAPEAFKDLKVTAKLIGQMFDFKSLVTDASFNSLTNTLTWDYRSIESLKNLDSGVAGDLSFTIKILSDYPIRRLNDRNFMIKADSKIESPTVPQGITATKTTSSDVWEAKIIGRVSVDAQGYFRDAPSLIVNDGPWPPRLNQPTNFTIHWLLTNFSTDISNVEVRARLEPGVTMTDKIKSNTSFVPVFDSATNEVVWKIDKLIATSGITGEKPSVIFQIKAIPRQDSLGKHMPLISDVRIKAIDDFTGVEINSSDLGLSTMLGDDQSVKPEEGIVIQ